MAVMHSQLTFLNNFPLPTEQKADETCILCNHVPAGALSVAAH